MRLLPRIAVSLSASLPLAGALLPSLLMAQSRPQLLASTEGPTTVRNVQIVAGHDGPAVEILSSRPLVPSIRKLDNPSRLVIDLPDAWLPWNRRRIDFRSEEITGVRVDQYQQAPPITRVVVDLAKPVGYTWDAAGNRLMVRLRASEEATAKPPSVPAFTQGIQPAAVPLSSGSSGAVVLAGSRVAAGSSVTAGSDAAILRLGRGGEVRVCPGTTVSVTSSQNGRSLMLGMSTGALEAHYYLDASADSIVTPDFRVLLTGPGEFHYAISADSRGNTCVRALPRNSASVIVSELLGDGTYQVKPSEQIVFRSGRLSLTDTAVPDSCGCPAPSIPVMRASAIPAPAISDVKLPSSVHLPQPADESKTPATPSPKPLSSASQPSGVKLSMVPPETAALPASKPNEVHVQVEAPFIFRADEPPQPPPAPIREARLLPLSQVPRSASLAATAFPPVLEPKPERHGFFGKLRNFFAAIFG